MSRILDRKKAEAGTALAHWQELLRIGWRQELFESDLYYLLRTGHVLRRYWSIGYDGETMTPERWQIDHAPVSADKAKDWEHLLIPDDLFENCDGSDELGSYTDYWQKDAL